jgi:DNA sulfur modification protein DndD
MEILDLKINNFGIFRGSYVFNLKPESKEKPVVLIGGLNGSGKTTLFDSVKICLYGRLYLSGVDRKHYEKYISSRVVPLTFVKEEKYQSSIEMNFILNEFGKSDYFTVIRSWTIQDKIFNENLNILKNSQKLEEVENEYNQAFLLNLIPRGIADLFIFDGEKIQELAEDTTDNEFFKTALDSILGLDIIDKLADDLKKYSFKQSPNIDRDREQQNFEKLQNDKKQLDEKIDYLNQERAQVISLRDNVVSRLANKEFELANHGGSYAEKRTQVKTKLEKCQRRIEYLRRRLNSLYSGLYPFSLCKELCLDFKGKLIEEKNRKSKLTSFKVLLESQSEFEKRLFSEPAFAKFSELPKSNVIDSIFNSMKDVLYKDSANGFEFVTDFSDNELEMVIRWIDDAVQKVSEETVLLNNKLIRSSTLRAKLEGYLSKIPDESLLTPIIQDLNKLYENKGLLEAKITEKDIEIALLTKQIKRISDDSTRTENNLEKVIKFDRKIETIHKVQRMIQEYKNTIREKKVTELEANLLSSLSVLLRKHDLVDSVHVNPETFKITMKRNDGTVIETINSSNGEKQVLSIGILLALSRTTKKSLPFIIDTPLARLDSNHRENIVHKFFPEASHQVIIFSTDTEIDEKFFKSLEPSLTRSYHLVYDPSTLSSRVEEGYFQTLEAPIR